MSHPRSWLTWWLALVILLMAVPAWAIAPDIVIRMGQTIVYTVPEGVDRVVVGDGDVIDVKALPGQNRDLLINAKKPGITNFLVWPQATKGYDGRMVQGPVRNYNLEVLTNRRPDLIAVRTKIFEVYHTDHDKTGVGWSDSVQWLEAAPDAPFRLGLPQRGSLLSARLDMMVQESHAKLLAQPTLLTLSGASASFLSGGELPIPLIVRDNVSIEWKPYGIRLDVAPQVEGIDTIVMRVRPEVSRIDRENSIQLPSVSVPAIATRWTETSMQVKSGESVVLSGLLSDEDTEVTTGIPVLSSIPFLGEAFKTHELTKQRTELVFLLTPTVVTNPATMPENDYGKH